MIYAFDTKYGFNVPSLAAVKQLLWSCPRTCSLQIWQRDCFVTAYPPCARQTDGVTKFSGLDLFQYYRILHTVMEIKQKMSIICHCRAYAVLIHIW